MYKTQKPRFKGFFAIGLMVTSLLSCQKENTVQPAVNAFSQSSDLAADSSLKIMVLQPGTTGQDAYVVYIDGDVASGDGNYNSVPELAMVSWTINGVPVTERSFIKFTGLSALPATARIRSAILSLSGTSSSIAVPQGNSVYPGSPYVFSYPDNSCYVQQVTSNWDESKITWNNQPNVITNDQVLIPSSTTQWEHAATADVTALVKRMVAKQKNYGLRIVQSTESYYRSMQFASSENADSTKRPTLTLKYTLK